jgi:hypothetical protein
MGTAGDLSEVRTNSRVVVILLECLLACLSGVLNGVGIISSFVMVLLTIVKEHTVQPRRKTDPLLTAIYLLGAGACDNQ